MPRVLVFKAPRPHANVMISGVHREELKGTN